MQSDRSEIALRYNQEQIQSRYGPSDILYLRLAEAYSQYHEAISAACASLEKKNPKLITMITINDILQDAKDRDTYIQSLDWWRRETQQDNPLVRRLLGQLLVSDKEYELVIEQYRAVLSVRNLRDRGVPRSADPSLPGNRDTVLRHGHIVLISSRRGQISIEQLARLQDEFGHPRQASRLAERA